MRTFLSILGLMSVTFSASSFATDLPMAVSCPDASLKETILDCPWADIARDVEHAIDSRQNAATRLDAVAPKYMERIEFEGKITPFKALWGTSINFDEGAKAIIIAPEIIDAIIARFGVAPRKDRYVHAGIEHTYGYLLSNLNTPYGYKRLRWVRDDIEKGFNLPQGVISPLPKDGGLFSNVTYFAGSFAFRDSPEAMNILKRSVGVSASLKKFDLAKLPATRLVETIQITPKRKVQLRTDFVFFTHAKGENGAVLIYSIKDSDEKLPYLISMFPVAESFANGPLNPKSLGDGQEIKTRYNAYVSGVTDAGKTFTGNRCVVSASEKCEK